MGDTTPDTAALARPAAPPWKASPATASDANAGAPAVVTLAIADVFALLVDLAGASVVRVARTCRGLLAAVWTDDLLARAAARFPPGALGRRGAVAALQARWAAVGPKAAAGEVDAALLGAARGACLPMARWILAGGTAPSGPALDAAAEGFARRAETPAAFVRWLIAEAPARPSDAGASAALAAVCEWGRLGDVQAVYAAFDSRPPGVRKSVLGRCLVVAQRLACHAHVARWARRAITALEERYAV